MATTDDPDTIRDAVAAACASAWFGNGNPARTWEHMTEYERRRFRALARAAILAYIEAVVAVDPP